MLKREHIVDGVLVYNQNSKRYLYISNVGNAIVKGDRSEGSDPNELSFTVTDLVTLDEVEVCENSHMTSNYLSTASPDEVRVYLQSLEADQIIKMGKARKRLLRVQKAILNFTNAVLQ